MVTVKVPEEPTVKVVDEADVIELASSTVRVNACDPAGVTLFDAVMEMS